MTVIAVVSKCGTIGKSTIASHCLAAYPPRKDTQAELITVETINHSGTGPASTANYKGANVDKILSHILIESEGKDVVIDIGSSNLEAFSIATNSVGQVMAGEIGVWVIPFILDPKVFEDTKATIEGLLALKIPKKRILCLANRIKPEDENEALARFGHEVFTTFNVGFCEETVHENEVFAQNLHGRRVCEIANDKTDYRAEITKAATREAKQEALMRRILVGLAQTASANLASVAAAVWKAAK